MLDHASLDGRLFTAREVGVVECDPRTHALTQPLVRRRVGGRAAQVVQRGLGDLGRDEVRMPRGGEPCLLNARNSSGRSVEANGTQSEAWCDASEGKEARACFSQLSLVAQKTSVHFDCSLTSWQSTARVSSGVASDWGVDRRLSGSPVRSRICEARRPDGEGSISQGGMRKEREFASLPSHHSLAIDDVLNEWHRACVLNVHLARRQP